MVSLSKADEIMAELIAAGYDTYPTTPYHLSISDMERLRLLVVTGVSSAGHSMNDLYALAGERPRL